MPIMLDDATQVKNVAKKSIFAPKFFNKRILTGSGKKSGLICELANPKYIPANRNTNDNNINCLRTTLKNGNVTIETIPLNPLTAHIWNDMYTLAMPTDVTTLPKIATHNNLSIYLEMNAHSLIYEEMVDPNKAGLVGSSISKKLTPCYQMFLYIIDDTAIGLNASVERHISKQSMKKDVYYTDFTCNPARLLSAWYDDLKNANCNIDIQIGEDYLNAYSLYDGICKAATIWCTSIDKLLDNAFENCATAGTSSATIKQLLRYLEDYDIPLDLYRNIYTSVCKHFNAADATDYCKQNLNLLLSDTLNSLNANKALLTTIPVAPPNMVMPKSLIPFSKEQQAVITTPEPLVLTQAGAGTGKSTVIRGRIDYMEAVGIPSDDITVLSFTNAAANNILKTHPNIHSMTIAKMVHDIYSTNFPAHELSSISTLINAIDIYFPANDDAKQLRNRLYAIKDSDKDAFTRMNNFVEANYDKVMSILDTVKQTCLELEIIVCYQKIDTLSEPAEIQSKYLIVDEVQDNSIFEFIYILKYVDKHKESLCIVGDCSQTLYEFRASNPKALNVLEGSGVFVPYKLQVNYRSNQEILDFANVTLNNIEANQYAKIQLQANSLVKVTEQSFTDKVNFHYERVAKMSLIDANSIGVLFALRLKPYLDAKYAAKSQVCCLAYSRRDVYAMQDAIQKMYPAAICANITSEKSNDNTLFSSFIKKYWDQLQFAPTQNIYSVVVQEIYNKAPYIFSRGDAQLNIKRAQKLVHDWSISQKTAVDEWQIQYGNGIITLDDLLNNVKQSLLDHEIKNNAIRQRLVSAKNEENKTAQAVANADFIFSTIHGAKGLEFTNTVVLYKDTNDISEADKRMYYVAFTRAQESEFILAYGTLASPKLEGDYKTLVKQLHATAPIPAGAGPVVVTTSANEPLIKGDIKVALGNYTLNDAGEIVEKIVTPDDDSSDETAATTDTPSDTE